MVTRRREAGAGGCLANRHAWGLLRSTSRPGGRVCATDGRRAVQHTHLAHLASAHQFSLPQTTRWRQHYSATAPLPAGSSLPQIAATRVEALLSISEDDAAAWMADEQTRNRNDNKVRDSASLLSLPVRQAIDAQVSQHPGVALHELPTSALDAIRDAGASGGRGDNEQDAADEEEDALGRGLSLGSAESTRSVHLAIPRTATVADAFDVLTANGHGGGGGR